MHYAACWLDWLIVIAFSISTAYSEQECDFNREWCWVRDEERQRTLNFLDNITVDSKPKKLLIYQVRLNPHEPFSLQGGWQMHLKWVNMKDAVVYGVFSFPWRPRDTKEYKTGFKSESLEYGDEDANKDRPFELPK